jgi:guanylate kinase
MKGSIFIVSAPSGAGKTTLCKKLTETTEGIRHSVSYTTREPRKGEKDGRDYFFVSEEKFMEMVRRGEFLEWAEVHGNLYGTSKRYIQEIINTGTDVILDIDTQGARQIRDSGIEATFIFILPPSLKALEERLRKRGTDPEETIRRRLKQAKKEISDYKMYDYVIFNIRVDEAVEQLRSIVIAKRLSINRIDHKIIEREFLK